MALQTKSFILRKEDVQPEWLVVDADGLIVGRLATKIATVLMGKHKPTYTAHVLCGDFVVVLNAERIRFGGTEIGHPQIPYYSKKMGQKEYDKYTGYPGGRKVATAEDVWSRHPERLITEAVRRMLPKNKLGRQMLKMLKVYKGNVHPHQAQQPQPWPEHLAAK